MVRDHADLMPMGASILGQRRQDVGDQLDHGAHAIVGAVARLAVDPTGMSEFLLH
jgi:hypothetical protein